MIFKRIIKFLLSDLPEELWLIIILLPVIPVILFVENDTIKNFLYFILVPIWVLTAGILIKWLNKRNLFEKPEKREITAEPILDQSNHQNKAEHIIDEKIH